MPSEGVSVRHAKGSHTHRFDRQEGCMSTVLEFLPREAARSREPIDRPLTGEIVVFPGVRIERHDLDLGHRVRNSAGCDEFNGLGRKRKPGKSS